MTVSADFSVVVFGLVAERPEQSVHAALVFGLEGVALQAGQHGSHQFAFITLEAARGGIEGAQMVLHSRRLPLSVRIYLDSAAEEALRAHPHAAAQTLITQADEAGRQRKKERWKGWGRFARRLAIGLPLVWLGYHALVQAVVVLIPPSWESRLGNFIFPAGKPADPQVQETLDAISRKLLATVPDSPYAFRFQVVRSTSINAFVAPGGFIGIHAALAASADSPEELAGVMAHEIQHVLRRHTLRRLVYESGLFVVVDGLFTGGGASAGYLAAVLANLSYSRDNERDADKRGVEMLIRAGISPQGMVRFFEKMQAPESAQSKAWSSFLRTHPMDAERIAYLKVQAAKAPAMQPLVVQWGSFKQRVGQKNRN